MKIRIKALPGVQSQSNLSCAHPQEHEQKKVGYGQVLSQVVVVVCEVGSMVMRELEWAFSCG